MATNTKSIGNGVTVNTGDIRELWSNGYGDEEIVVCAAGSHVWIETNGDPVNDVDGFITLLVERGIPEVYARAASEGDFRGLEDSDGWIIHEGSGEMSDHDKFSIEEDCDN